MFQPTATSTPAHTSEYHPSPGQEMFDNNHHVPINYSTEPAGVASNDLPSVLEATIREKSNVQKQNKILEGENSIKENNDRLNRLHFFLKNVVTSMTYMDVFISIVTQYSLVRLNTAQNSPKIQYLCIAGNVLLIWI